jgi:hypothetical protein
VAFCNLIWNPFEHLTFSSRPLQCDILCDGVQNNLNRNNGGDDNPQPSKSLSLLAARTSISGLDVGSLLDCPLTSVPSMTFQSPPLDSFNFLSSEKKTCRHYVGNANESGPGGIVLKKFPMANPYLSVTIFVLAGISFAGIQEHKRTMQQWLV